MISSSGRLSYDSELDCWPEKPVALDTLDVLGMYDELEMVDALGTLDAPTCLIEVDVLEMLDGSGTFGTSISLTALDAPEKLDTSDISGTPDVLNSFSALEFSETLDIPGTQDDSTDDSTTSDTARARTYQSIRELKYLQTKTTSDYHLHFTYLAHSHSNAPQNINAELIHF